MKEYEVAVTLTLEFRTVITLDAASEDAARKEAEAAARSMLEGLYPGQVGDEIAYPNDSTTCEGDRLFIMGVETTIDEATEHKGCRAFEI